MIKLTIGITIIDRKRRSDRNQFPQFIVPGTSAEINLNPARLDVPPHFPVELAI